MLDQDRTDTAQTDTGRADDGPTGGTRHDGWTLERQVDFLEALAATGSVPRAAVAVGMSASGACRARGRAGN